MAALPKTLDVPHKPLPFAYISTGAETAFMNHLDSHPRKRERFTFHRSETMREWLSADTLDEWIKRSGGSYTKADDTKPSTLQSRLRAMPPVDLPGMSPNKVRSVTSIEKGLFDDRPRCSSRWPMLRARRCWRSPPSPAERVWVSTRARELQTKTEP